MQGVFTEYLEKRHRHILIIELVLHVRYEILPEFVHILLEAHFCELIVDSLYDCVDSDCELCRCHHLSDRGNHRLPHCHIVAKGVYHVYVECILICKRGQYG